MIIKACLFDMDGVLVDSFEAWYRLFCLTLEHFDRPAISREEFMQRAWARGYEKVSKHYFADQPLQEVAAYYFSHFSDYKQHLKLIDGVSVVLEQARMLGLELAVISNTYVRLVEEFLDGTGLLKYFKTIIGGDMVAYGKPAPDMVFLACSKLGIKPDEALVVGDTKYDIAAARAAGCLAVGYKIAGDVQIDNLQDLLNIIENKRP
jgi:pyrophosphatase PpaX